MKKNISEFDQHLNFLLIGDVLYLWTLTFHSMFCFFSMSVIGNEWGKSPVYTKTSVSGCLQACATYSNKWFLTQRKVKCKVNACVYRSRVLHPNGSRWIPLQFLWNLLLIQDFHQGSIQKGRLCSLRDLIEFFLKAVYFYKEWSRIGYSKHIERSHKINSFRNFNKLWVKPWSPAQKPLVVVEWFPQWCDNT